ncbi:NADH:ubiquinone oxidoreductase subunit NDUFA12 [Flexibacterium corallicola]|uniref:NADH:ubiquinone oxidoreductase subunit NDUFA12 n=1 Tax=Flexibacterium corallicola TaxID=3037259 RepID=UPI00286F0E53|nr:NADH:ubiquinone oxidoreductase subunit NDUFA12 [Pseudovibrio sp. M1P-2-3]
MKRFILQLFSWWHEETMGTRFFTWRKGVLVGTDENGNTYYKERDGNRRWVKYSGLAEASMIPPGWHGWMHHRTDTPPTEEEYSPKEWEGKHQPNMTGTSGAYRPKGSILGADKRPEVTGDYEAWTPGN